MGAVEVPMVEIASEEALLPLLGLGTVLGEDVETGVVVAEGCGLGVSATVVEELEGTASPVAVVDDGIVLSEVSSLVAELSSVVETACGDVVGVADIEVCISAASAV